MKSETLWRDPSDKSFWLWGGETSYGAAPPADGAWQFTADGSGGGSWAQQTPGNPSTFSKLKRAVLGLTTAGDDTGFYLGGFLSAGTDASIAQGDPNDYYIPGIVSFNTSTGDWANSSSTPLIGNGLSFGGGAVFMPSFGPNGLLAFIGG